METLQKAVAASAMHDGQREADHTVECHPSTRRRHLERMKIWADRPHAKKRVQWMRGPAGAGKTAIVRSTCAILQEILKIPFASFFFWKTDSSRNNLKCFAATIAYQLVQKIPDLRPRIEEMLQNDPLLLGRSFKTQMEALVIDPFLSSFASGKITERHIVIVVDGLDECADDGRELLRFVPYFLSKLDKLPISFFMASRPEVSIANVFRDSDLESITIFSTLEASNEDIEEFLAIEFKRIYSGSSYLQRKYKTWPAMEYFKILVRKSSGYFICPKTAIRYIDNHERGLRPDDRLEIVLSAITDVDSDTPWHEPLDQLYRGILKRHAPRRDLDGFRTRIGLLCIPGIAYPLNLHFVTKNTWALAFFHEIIDNFQEAIADLTSLFSLDRDGIPVPHHASLPDFLFNRDRSLDFYSDKESLHARIASDALHFILTSNDLYECRRFVPTDERNIEFYIRQFVPEHIDRLINEPLETFAQRCIDDFPFDRIPTTPTLLELLNTLDQVLYMLDGIMSREYFPQGKLRRRAIRLKLNKYLAERIKVAAKGDFALFNLAYSPRSLPRYFSFPLDFPRHTMECFQNYGYSSHNPPPTPLLGDSSICLCSGPKEHRSLVGLNVHMVNQFNRFVTTNAHLTLFRDCDIARDTFDGLALILSFSPCQTPRFESHCWVYFLLRFCRLGKELYGTLITNRLRLIEECVDDALKQSIKDSIDDYISRCDKARISASPPMPADEPGEIQPHPSDVQVHIHRDSATESNPHLPPPIHLQKEHQLSASRRSSEQLPHTLTVQGPSPDSEVDTIGNVTEGRTTSKKRWHSRVVRRLRKVF